MNNEYHEPVLLEEMLQYLQPVRKGIYVDGTLGGGGYTEFILNNMPNRNQMICFDMDTDAISYSRKRLSEFENRITFVQDNFANIREQLQRLGINAIQGLVLDLGVSSRQIEEHGRGFSFQGDSRIDMRMNSQQTLSGWTVVNTYDQVRLADILWQYGEERNSRRIAKTIVESRANGSIDTTRQLADIVESAIGGAFLHKSLARIFQAIRIEVNKELDNLQRVLEDVVDMLATGGRIVVISYHSLEDRIVKQFFKQEAATSIKAANKILPDIPLQPRLQILTKKTVEATQNEIRRNPRARSAKLRAAERI